MNVPTLATRWNTMINSLFISCLPQNAVPLSKRPSTTAMVVAVVKRQLDRSERPKRPRHPLFRWKQTARSSIGIGFSRFQFARAYSSWKIHSLTSNNVLEAPLAELVIGNGDGMAACDEREDRRCCGRCVMLLGEML